MLPLRTPEILPDFRPTQKVFKSGKEQTDEEVESVLDFCGRVHDKSGLGFTETYLPPSINPGLCGNQVRLLFGVPSFLVGSPTLL